MNAKKARQLAKKVNIHNEASQYADIKSKIENEANDGKYETFYYQSLLKDVEEKLIEEGFNIRYLPDRMNETIIKITW